MLLISKPPIQWCLHAAAFYDHLARIMCLCRVALSCSHCDIVNQTLQIRRIKYRSTVALSAPMCQITTDVPMSDIIISLTLVVTSVTQADGIHCEVITNGRLP